MSSEDRVRDYCQLLLNYKNGSKTNVLLGNAMLYSRVLKKRFKDQWEKNIQAIVNYSFQFLIINLSFFGSSLQAFLGFNHTAYQNYLEHLFLSKFFKNQHRDRNFKKIYNGF